MNCKHHASLLLAALCGLASCSDDNPWLGAEGEGAIRLTLAADGSVEDAIPIVRGSDLFTVPEAADFSIRLEKKDGSYSRTFATVEEFAAQPGFPTGAYMLTAFYGNAEEQGFELPCFSGSTDLTVLEGRTTEVSVTATVSNSLVSISYTDAFKDYLSDYSVKLHTEGHSYVEVPGDETRPAFVAPGEVNLAVSFSNPQGQSVTVQPTSFAALPGHHYHITLDVNSGQVGQAQLTVIFDDSLETEDVVLDLTEELFTSKAPEIRAAGFTSGDDFEFLAGSAPESSLKFNVFAAGGMQQVMLTIASSTYTPPFGKEVNLVGASAEVRQQLEQLGIDVKGIFSNPDRMAVVDISRLPAALPAGRYEISLVAKDNFTRISEPVTVSFTSVAPSLEVTPLSAVYGINSASMEVAYNGSHPQEDITFKALNKYGNYVDAEVTSVSEVTRTRSIATRNYIFNIRLADTDRAEIPVKVYLYGKEVKTVKVPVEMPQYSLQTDAMANAVMVKVDADEAQRAVIVENLRFFNGNSAIEPSGISRYPEAGIVVVGGLAPATQYALQATILPTLDSSAIKLDFTTEAAAQVPNGDFEQLSVTYDNKTITQGGAYTRTLIGPSAHNTQNFTISEPAGWSSNNALTCNLGAATVNSWFVCPAVFNTSLSWSSTTHKFSPGFGGETSTPDAYVFSAKSGDNAMVVRSVGWSANGTEPAVDKKTAGPSGYYSSKIPSAFNRAAGSLSLGSDASAGAAFSTRPTMLKGYYIYTRDAGDLSDEGVVTVAVMSGGEVIATATKRLAPASGYTLFSLPLEYDAAKVFGKKATALRISFSSSGKSSPSVTSYAELHRQESTGSVLVVDNLYFEY